MRHYLKDNDEVITDNVKLVYENGQFKSIEGSLAHTNMYVYDEETEQEYEVEYEMVGDVLTPYYEKPEHSDSYHRRLVIDDTDTVLERGYF